MFPERSFVLVQFCHLCIVFGAMRGILGLWPTEAVCVQFIPVWVVCAHLYTELQLFLGICPRWWWWVWFPLHMLLFPSFPNSPSLVPFQRTSGTHPRATIAPASTALFQCKCDSDVLNIAALGVRGRRISEFQASQSYKVKPCLRRGNGTLRLRELWEEGHIHLLMRPLTRGSS